MEGYNGRQGMDGRVPRVGGVGMEVYKGRKSRNGTVHGLEGGEWKGTTVGEGRNGRVQR